MAKVSLPHNWTPRPYQEPFWNAMLRGCKRAMLIWHRRAGKDLSAVNWAVFDMTLLHPGGAWWHVWPTYEQGRKFWEGADNNGRRFTDYFPKELIKRKREDMMLIEFHNGSIYRVVGSDEPDKLVGANPIGLIMTEFSLQNPAAWDFLRPIVTANDGTVIFPFTPRGHNHAYQLYSKVRGNPQWFVSVQGLDKTNALPPSVIEEERMSGMSEELIQQEYYCSFTAPLTGAYYAAAMKRAQEQGRITRVAYDPNLPVETWWDLGMNDHTAIWFAQRHLSEIRLIDYAAGTNDEGLLGWIPLVKSKPYIYSGHLGPHDLSVRSMNDGISRAEFARKHGFDFTIVPKHGLEDGIDAVRRELNACWFDEDRCFDGIEALKAYKKKWDDKRQAYSSTPDHDWASDPADAFRTGVMGKIRKPNKDLHKRVQMPYDPFKASRPYGR